MSYSLIYFECNGTGTDGTCTAVLVLIILASGLLVLALVLKVLTALALILMILAQSYHIFTDGF